LKGQKGKDVFSTEINPGEFYKYDSSRTFEPTPSLKALHILDNNLRHLTAFPLTGAGNIDYYASVAVASDNRFAYSMFEKVILCPPILELTSLPDTPGNLLLE
jgi:hypothetical protein